VNVRSFSKEPKRRNVHKVAIAYAVMAWLLMQVASQIFPFFEIPQLGRASSGVAPYNCFSSCADPGLGF
jgi:hypothetical protein